MTPRKYRTLVQAYLSVVAVAGACLGLVGGGAFQASSTTTISDVSGSWRNLFWLLCAGYFCIAILFAALYHPPARPIVASKTASFDIVSCNSLAQKRPRLNRMAECDVIGWECVVLDWVDVVPGWDDAGRWIVSVEERSSHLTPVSLTLTLIHHSQLTRLTLALVYSDSHSWLGSC